MAVSSTSVVTYESRQIISDDSARASALFQVTTTTTVRTAPDTPVGTTVSESVEFLSIDYTPIYTVISNNIETISNNVETIKDTLQSVETLASGDGIKTMNVYDWVLLSSMYKLYVDDSEKENYIGIDQFLQYLDKIKNLPKL